MLVINWTFIFNGYVGILNTTDALLEKRQRRWFNFANPVALVQHFVEISFRSLQSMQEPPRPPRLVDYFCVIGIEDVDHPEMCDKFYDEFRLNEALSGSVFFVFVSFLER